MKARHGLQLQHARPDSVRWFAAPAILAAICACCACSPAPTDRARAATSTSAAAQATTPATAPSTSAAAASSSAPSPPALSPADMAPVDRVVSELSRSRLWRNGHFPKLELPATATLDELIDAVAEASTFGRGKAKTHRLVGSTTVRIGGEDYLAAVVDTDSGRKVILFQYEESMTAWWSRVFDATEAKPRP